MVGDDPYEDRQPAPSRAWMTWTPEHKFQWKLEVRERMGAVNLRLGEVLLQGSFDGTLTLAIESTGFQYGGGWHGGATSGSSRGSGDPGRSYA